MLCKAPVPCVRHCFEYLMFYHRVTNSRNFLFRTVDVMSLPFFPRCSAPDRHSTATPASTVAPTR